MSRTTRFCLVFAATSLISGCGSQGIDTEYGRIAGKSLNGTSVLAELVRERGHTVRAAVRLNDSLKDNADTIVRFAPYAGPPDDREASWYREWLSESPKRKLLYIVRDYDATIDYWSEVLKTLPAAPDNPDRLRAQKLLGQAHVDGASDISTAEQPPTVRNQWFRVDSVPAPKPDTTAVLGEWWADGIDAKAADLPLRHRLLEFPLRKWDAIFGEWDTPLVVNGNFFALRAVVNADHGEMLVLANGSFLVNGGLLNRARRPLARHVVDWLDSGGERVVFVEGIEPVSDQPADGQSSLSLLREVPICMIVAHFLGFGLLVCLYLGTRLGRPRGEPPPGVGRPAAHAEALGDLLARTRKPDDARSLLEAYHRWRTPDRRSSSS